MKTKMKSVYATILCLLIPCTTSATDHQFVNTSAGIIGQLTEKKDSVPSSPFSVIESPTQAITVRVKEKGQELDKVVLVKDDAMTGDARLKVEFDIASARLRPCSLNVLDQLGDALADVRLSGQQVCIKGHTDSDGDDDYNRHLSYQRAEAVREYIKTNSRLSQSNLFAVGYGEQMPLAVNNTPMRKQMNRRVEITLGCPDVQ